MATTFEIATWNVNSIRARLPRVTDWLQQHPVDVLCLQETKVVDDDFPRAAFVELGYEVAVFGQKTYNGVALASRLPLEAVVRGLPDAPADEERRLIAARCRGVRLVNVYVPNGTALESPRFGFKLRWLERLQAFLAATEAAGEAVIVGGDFNVAPDDRDVHDPQRWHNRLHCHPDERRALAGLMGEGLVDLFREQTAEGGHFTWWDYRAGAFHRGWGLRIDLLLASRALAADCRSVAIDREARKGPKPSDHAPVTARFLLP